MKHLRVEVGLEESTDLMKPGMTVRAEVLVDHADDVVSVPREAVFFRDEEPVVYVRGRGGFEAVPVSLGLRNDIRVVVESGVEEGAEVALVDPEAHDDGEPRRPGVPAGAPARVGAGPSP